jgi:hypothetical protein
MLSSSLVILVTLVPDSTSTKNVVTVGPISYLNTLAPTLKSLNRSLIFSTLTSASVSNADVSALASGCSSKSIEGTS